MVIYSETFREADGSAVLSVSSCLTAMERTRGNVAAARVAGVKNKMDDRA